LICEGLTTIWEFKRKTTLTTCTTREMWGFFSHKKPWWLATHVWDKHCGCFIHYNVQYVLFIVAYILHYNCHWGKLQDIISCNCSCDAWHSYHAFLLYLTHFRHLMQKGKTIVGQISKGMFVCVCVCGNNLGFCDG
jgi:hypothetical protein